MGLRVPFHLAISGFDARVYLELASRNCLGDLFLETCSFMHLGYELSEQTNVYTVPFHSG
jgi:hypothetical protein